VRLWFDEDLSPTLVRVAQERGFEATCNRDRGVLGIKDPQLREAVQRENFVLVTDNASDFRPMYARDEVHPGLIVMPAGPGRDHQRELARQVIDWIVSTASATDQTPAEFMVNRLVDIDADGVVDMYDLP
jgi:predicted nuclease of predicted toxin-antitoxin system